MKLPFIFLALATCLSPLAAEIHHAQGEMAGEPSADSVFLQSRLTAIPGPELDPNGEVPGAAGVACFEWSESSDFSEVKRTAWLKAVPEFDFIVRAKLEGLKTDALNDENAIKGEKPGRKGTTDPEGLIDQRFLDPKPTGGFLHVGLGGDSSQLRIAFLDDEGNSPYGVTRKNPDKSP